jgi:hypothetical protein
MSKSPAPGKPRANVEKRRRKGSSWTDYSIAASGVSPQRVQR